MSERYYTPGPDRSQRVRQLFARIATRYDLINDVQSLGLHRFWKRQLIAAARLTGRGRVLDVCCGTGDIALRLSAQAACTVGCDFSPEMLEQAALRNSSAVSWVHADALQLPFATESFDTV